MTSKNKDFILIIYFRLAAEIANLKDDLKRCESMRDHYKLQLDILERSIGGDGGNNKSKIAMGENDLAQLLEAMRLLRHDLELSMEKQKELQFKLEETLRQSRTPREFTFSGRGVSYSDLHIIDASGFAGAENISSSTLLEDCRMKPGGSSTFETEYAEFNQQQNGELERRCILNNFFKKIHIIEFFYFLLKLLYEDMSLVKFKFIMNFVNLYKMLNLI